MDTVFELYKASQVRLPEDEGTLDSLHHWTFNFLEERLRSKAILDRNLERKVRVVRCCFRLIDNEFAEYYQRDEVSMFQLEKFLKDILIGLLFHSCMDILGGVQFEKLSRHTRGD